MNYKDFLFGKEQAVLRNWGLLLLRLFSGLTMAFGHGYSKLPPSAGFIKGVDGMGFPLPSFFAWAAASAEFFGGVLIAIGLFTRPSVLLLGITMMVAGFIRHGDDPFASKEKALLYFFICLCIFLTGPGKFSVDNGLLKKK